MKTDLTTRALLIAFAVVTTIACNIISTLVGNPLPATTVAAPSTILPSSSPVTVDIGQAAPSSNVPPFLKLGATYNMTIPSGEIRVTIREIVNDQWLRGSISYNGQSMGERWINLNQIGLVQEAK